VTAADVALCPDAHAYWLLVREAVYVDTDPVFTQVRYARGAEAFRKQVDAHDIHFSYAECLSTEHVPGTGLGGLRAPPSS
jgi:hypothetical protein